MTRRIQISTIVSFFVILAVPYIQEQFHIFKYAPVLEYRPKKTRPTDFRAMLSPGNPFSRKYEEYFDDTYGLRDLLIRTKNQIDYSLFHRSDTIVIGRDDWLFYKSVVEQGEVYIEMNPPDSFDRLFRRIVNLNKMLKIKGITMVVVPLPMKNTVYPEFVPDSTARRPNPSGFQKYRAFLRQHSEIVTVDGQSILEALKTSFPVFHKTDFHWNDVAGFCVARELMNKLGHLSGVGDAWDLPLEIKKERYKVGGENRALALLRPIKEYGLFLESDAQPWTTGGWKETDDPNQWEYQAKGAWAARARIPPTAMFGDSFADAWVRASFYIFFYRLSKFNIFDFKKYLLHLPDGTRFLIMEQTETYLNNLLDDGFWPPEVSSDVSKTQ
ncbi:MAG TPA: hypothetical protein VGQ81_04915 [Acidobacteriota bacterium]|nr:hypothetical protein [Acidobacteriota bacterium]